MILPISDNLMPKEFILKFYHRPLELIWTIESVNKFFNFMNNDDILIDKIDDNVDANVELNRSDMLVDNIEIDRSDILVDKIDDIDYDVINIVL